jgi:hypothetical protein
MKSLVENALFLRQDYNEDQPRAANGQWGAGQERAAVKEAISSVQRALPKEEQRGHGYEDLTGPRFHSFAEDWHAGQGDHPNLAESVRRSLQLHGLNQIHKDPTDLEAAQLTHSAAGFATQAASHLANGRPAEALEHARSAMTRLEQHKALLASPQGQLRAEIVKLQSKPPAFTGTVTPETYAKYQKAEKSYYNKLGKLQDRYKAVL